MDRAPLLISGPGEMYSFHVSHNKQGTGSHSVSSVSQPRPQFKQSPVAKTSGTRPFGDLQVRVTAAQERVAKLEIVLAAQHGVEGPEIESLRVAFKRAKEVKVQPVDVQIKECEGFLIRARAHLTELDAKRTTVSTNIREAEQRLEALKQIQFVIPPLAPVDAEAEIRQLRATVAQMKGQLEGAQPAMAEGQAPKRICRREDFVPIVRGRIVGVDRRETGRLAGRQVDLNEVMSVGRPDEVARISNIMCQAAPQWQQEVATGILPSMVSNNVS